MPKPKKGPRLRGSPAHQRLMLSNLATALFEHGRITTTETRARLLRPVAEKLITKAKRGDLHNRREVLKTIRDKSVVHTLFTEIAPTFSERPGGYTRITKVGPRKGDNAPMAVGIQLVTEAYSPKAPSTKKTEAAAAPAPAGRARGVGRGSRRNRPKSTEESDEETEAIDGETEAAHEAIEPAAEDHRGAGRRGRRRGGRDQGLISHLVSSARPAIPPGWRAFARLRQVVAGFEARRWRSSHSQPARGALRAERRSSAASRLRAGPPAWARARVAATTALVDLAWGRRASRP